MPTIVHGNFEWDLDKDLFNIEKHRLSFEQAFPIFKQDRYTSDEIHHISGEIRHFTVGLLWEKEFTVVYTQRDERRRLISFRRASDEERIIYREYLRARSAHKGSVGDD